MESASILAATNYSTKDVNHRNESTTSCSIFRRAAAIRSGLLPTQDKSSGAAILYMLPQLQQLPNVLSKPRRRQCVRISETTPVSIQKTAQ